MTKIFRTIILTLIFGPGVLCAHGRQSLPIPVAEDTALSRIESEDITGWTYGEDLRWYSVKHSIPMHTTTFKWEKLRNDRAHALGEENIQFLEVFRMYYGTKPYIVVVKGIMDGVYEYPERQRGWDESPRLHYFVMDESELEKIHAKNSIGTFIYSLRLVDHGFVPHVKFKKRERWIEEICKKAVPHENYPWELMFHVSLFGEQNVARFQLYAMHRVFKDIDGVRNVQQLRGERIYGKDELMEYFYYEVPFSQMFQYLHTLSDS